MKVSAFLQRELSHRQLVLFFLLATALYVLPLSATSTTTGDYGFIVMKESPHGRLLQW